MNDSKVELSEKEKELADKAQRAMIIAEGALKPLGYGGANISRIAAALIPLL